jgi:hypothetical protein
MNDSMTKDLCRLREKFSTAICFRVFSNSMSEERRPDSHPLTLEAMFFSTDVYKCFCFDCASSNCITHIDESSDQRRDFYGECLDCGSLRVEWETSPIRGELIEMGVAV